MDCAVSQSHWEGQTASVAAIRGTVYRPKSHCQIGSRDPAAVTADQAHHLAHYGPWDWTCQQPPSLQHFALLSLLLLARMWIMDLCPAAREFGKARVGRQGLLEEDSSQLLRVWVATKNVHHHFQTPKALTR